MTETGYPCCLNEMKIPKENNDSQSYNFFGEMKCIKLTVNLWNFMEIYTKIYAFPFHRRQQLILYNFTGSIITR